MYEVLRYEPSQPKCAIVVKTPSYNRAREWARDLNALARSRDGGARRYPIYFVEGGSDLQRDQWNAKQRCVG